MNDRLFVIPPTKGSAPESAIENPPIDPGSVDAAIESTTRSGVASTEYRSLVATNLFLQGTLGRALPPGQSTLQSVRAHSYAAHEIGQCGAGLDGLSPGLPIRFRSFCLDLERVRAEAETFIADLRALYRPGDDELDKGPVLSAERAAHKNWGHPRRRARLVHRLTTS